MSVNGGGSAPETKAYAGEKGGNESGGGLRSGAVEVGPSDFYFTLNRGK